ncbi:MAG: hypothetical protein AAGH99_08500 [Planctomycetota bacterium]
MPSPDLSTDAINALVGTRHPTTGIEFPPSGLQPYHDWLIRTLHRLAESSAGGLRVQRAEGDPVGICIASGRASIAGVALSLEEYSTSLAGFNNDTTLVWLADASGEAEVGTTSVANGWPSSDHLKLAEVSIEAGEITSILDRRFETVFRV